MDFGKLPRVDDVDFTLPPDHPDNARFFERQPPTTAKKELLLACPVWNHAGFVGKIYPPKTKATAYLHHYSRQFNSIELNSTFYGVKPEWVLKWRDAAPEGFLFSPKLTRQISHYRQLQGTRNMVEAFCQAMAGFEEKLGPMFLLLPPHFGPNRLPVLEQFLADFPPGYELGIEFRHPDWYTHPTALQAAFDLLEAHNKIAILTDVAGRRDVLHQRITSKTVILRFVGNSLHPTDFARLTDWAHRLNEWFEAGVERIFVWLHQPEEHLNVECALHLVEQINTVGGHQFTGPKLIQTAPTQGTLF